MSAAMHLIIIIKTTIKVLVILTLNITSLVPERNVLLVEKKSVDRLLLVSVSLNFFSPQMITCLFFLQYWAVKEYLSFHSGMNLYLFGVRGYSVSTREIVISPL